MFYNIKLENYNQFFFKNDKLHCVNNLLFIIENIKKLRFQLVGSFFVRKITIWLGMYNPIIELETITIPVIDYCSYKHFIIKS